MRLNQDLLDGFFELAEKEHCNYFVTLAFNRLIKPPIAARKLSQLHHQLDKRLFGPQFYKQPLERRTFFIACPEHLDSNFHYHLVSRIADDKRATFEEVISNIWTKICPGGSVKVSYVYDIENLKVVTGYSMKEAGSYGNYEEIILSPTFIGSSVTCSSIEKKEGFAGS